MPNYRTQCEEVLKEKGIRNFARRMGHGQPNKEIIVFDVGVSGTDVHFLISINERGQMVHIFSQPTWKTLPANKLGQALLFVTLLNWEVAVGSVDLDMNDGEVRYKTTADFGDAENIKPMLNTFMDFHLSCGVRYNKAFIAIKDDDASAEKAMEIAGHGKSKTTLEERLQRMLLS